MTAIWSPSPRPAAPVGAGTRPAQRARARARPARPAGADPRRNQHARSRRNHHHQPAGHAALLFNSEPRPHRRAVPQPLTKQARRQHLRVSITGYASPEGGAAYNVVLSERRAFAVRDQLIALGLPAAQITRVTGAGTGGQTLSACLAHGQLDEAKCATLRRVWSLSPPQKLLAELAAWSIPTAVQPPRAVTFPVTGRAQPVRHCPQDLPSKGSGAKACHDRMPPATGLPRARRGLSFRPAKAAPVPGRPAPAVPFRSGRPAGPGGGLHLFPARRLVRGIRTRPPGGHAMTRKSSTTWDTKPHKAIRYTRWSGSPTGARAGVTETPPSPTSRPAASILSPRRLRTWSPPASFPGPQRA